MEILSGVVNRSSAGLIPLPQLPISIRQATLADLPAIDALQKKYHKQLGFFPRGQMEEYLRNGWVVVAEERHEGTEARRHEGKSNDGHAPSLPAAYCRLPTLLGYCVSRDRYLKRDELGVIYQLCVDPSAQRKFIGAALLRAVFERAPYGCKLYCCWCAQDIAANYFWESMGFVPLAFRTGGRKGRAARGKGRAVSPERGRRENARSELAPGPSHLAPSSRVHIFWQKRIRQGDVTTPWWFPSKTDAGAIREDRIVLPIPQGVRWSDEMPRIVPERHEGTACPEQCRREAPAAAGKLRHEGVGGAELVASALTSDPRPRGSGRKKAAAAPKRNAVARNGMWYDIPKPPAAGAIVHAETVREASALQKPARQKPPRVKIKADPRLIAMARELRDRWLEEVNAGRYLPEMRGKYEVGRAVCITESRATGMLSAA